MCYLLFAGFVCVCGHVTLLALLALLVPIPDVFPQGGQALVAALTVGTGEQLGEGVRCGTLQLCTQSKTPAAFISLPPSCCSRGGCSRKQEEGAYRGRAPPGASAPPGLLGR